MNKTSASRSYKNIAVTSGYIKNADRTDANKSSNTVPTAFYGLGFVLIEAGKKYPPTEKGWQNKPHSFEEAQRWCKKGNIGILVNHPHAVLDLDHPDAVKDLQIPETTAWETRPGRLAYLVRWSESETEIAQILQGIGKKQDIAQIKLYRNGAHVGEIKLQRTYQVIPPSWKSVDGVRIDYKMVQDIPPATVSFKWLVEELQRLGISFSENNIGKARLDANIERLQNVQREVVLRADGLQKIAEDCLQTAIERGIAGCRNRTGFELACLLRNYGIDASTASEYMLRYQQAVRDRGDHEYTRDEALKSLKSAYQSDPPQKKVALKDQLLNEILETVELWHDGAGTGYVSFFINSGFASYPVKSAPFRHFLTRKFHDKFGKTPRKEDILSIVDLLDSIAASREVHKTYLRIAEHDNKIYIDLGRSDWKILEISAEGWKLVDRAPVRFIRHGRITPIPEPRRGGSWKNVIELLRLSDRESIILTLSWMLQAVWPHGPYVHLVLEGEQGSGKSILAQMLKLITDPSDNLLRRPPRDEEDLFVAARNERILSFDNLSGIQDWLSDALCCFSTGATYSKRQKYTDWEEAAISVRRPCVLNGIEAAPTRPDLLDRIITISLKPISSSDRRSEAELISAVESYLPEIWGLLADAASAGLRNRTRAKERLRGRLPRMADFAIWIAACEEVMPWDEGDFLEAYERNRSESMNTLIESDILASAVVELARQEALKERCFEGTATLLYEELTQVAGVDRSRPPKGWPANPNWMMRRLKRMAPALRAHGVDIEDLRDEKGAKMIRISLNALISKQSSPSTSSIFVDIKNDSTERHDRHDRHFTSKVLKSGGLGSARVLKTDFEGKMSIMSQNVDGDSDFDVAKCRQMSPDSDLSKSASGAPVEGRGGDGGGAGGAGCGSPGDGGGDATSTEPASLNDRISELMRRGDLSELDMRIIECLKNRAAHGAPAFELSQKLGASPAVVMESLKKLAAFVLVQNRGRDPKESFDGDHWVLRPT